MSVTFLLLLNDGGSGDIDEEEEEEEADAQADLWSVCNPHSAQIQLEEYCSKIPSGTWKRKWFIKYVL